MIERMRNTLVLLLVVLTPILSILHFWQLPAGIHLPVHWNIIGEPDFWVNKNTLFFFIIFFVVLQILFYVSYLFLPYLLKTCKANLTAAKNITATMMLFCFGIQELVVLSPLLDKNIEIIRLTIMGIGVLFIEIGYIMPTLKPNQWIGIRLKWTLENPEIWSIVHRSASKLWIIGGGGIIVCSLLFPVSYLGTIILFSVFLLCSISCIQAWRLARQKQKE